MGEQIAILVLLALAFGGGWYWRGAGAAEDGDGGGGGDLAALLDRGGEATSQVLAAARASVAAWHADGTAGEAARDLSAELERLREVVAALERRLGGENPLTVDATQAVETAALVERELRAGADEESPLIDAYVGALSDARMRYLRGATVARMVLALRD